MSFDTSPGADREKYLREMSDRLHDRFLERPAFLDLDFIRIQVKKLDSLIDELFAGGHTWGAITNRLGDPVEYADAVFAQRLLSPEVSSRAPRASVLLIVLKVLFVVAPVNFIFAIGPLILGLLILIGGWLLSALVVVGPVILGLHFAFAPSPLVGLSENLLLVAVFSLGQLSALFMMIVSRVLFWMVWSWLNWNISFLRAESRA